MLILSRKIGESIQIGDNIKIMVADIDSKGFIKIGIEAPKNVTVHRDEVYRKIALENKQAVQHKQKPIKLQDLAKKLREREEAKEG
ncbi:MAG: carbon storage regulator CsrA [Fibromonadaceae bacterium]|jgi:carbon storage regulator|nr:carbon storage regulator CsrA [Fibromonadaceae bacterium]